MFVAVDQCTAAGFTEAESGRGWKGPLECIWSKPPAQEGHLESVPSNVSRQLLNIFKERDS